MNENSPLSVSQSKPSLLFILFAGLPLFVPLGFIFNDLLVNSTANVLSQWLAGNNASPQQAFMQCFQYVLYFLPAVLIYAIWQSGNEDKHQSDSIAGDALIVKSATDDEANMSWKPIDISGNPTNNRKWLQVKEGVYAFKSTYCYQMFTYPLIGFSVVYIIFSIIAEANKTDVISASVILNGGWLVLIVAIALNIIFYLMSLSGFCIKTKTGEVQLGVDQVKFAQVRGIQVLSKQQSYTSGSGGIYTVYEVNVIFNGHQRFTVLNHGGLYDAFEQIGIINVFFNVPIYIADEVMIDITAHNKDVKFN